MEQLQYGYFRAYRRAHCSKLRLFLKISCKDKDSVLHTNEYWKSSRKS
jgi:hypothetical protein